MILLVLPADVCVCLLLHSLWKPLKGPVSDWPLALCDPASIDVQRDLEPCDLVYPDYVVENRQLYFNKSQKWVWCSDQQQDEAWIFLQSDTDGDTSPGGYELNSTREPGANEI